MMRLQNLASYVVIKQESATNAATLTSDAIDTKGYDELNIELIGTTSNAATNNPSVLDLLESDDTVATNFATFSGGRGDTDFTIPNSPTATTTQPFVRFNIDSRKRKRYMKIRVSPVTTQTFTAIAHLGRPEEEPNSDTERNVALQVNV